VINKKVIDSGSPRAATSWCSATPTIRRWTTSSGWWACPATRWSTKQAPVINGQPVPEHGKVDYLHPERLYYSKQFVEKLGDVEHRILNDGCAGIINDASLFPFRENCIYNNVLA
jgi:signal peptidase I